jgi:3-methyladenine DNA glycosylase AlkD
LPVPPSSPDLLRGELRARIRPGYASSLAGFFKTGPGGYSEGDRFLGVRIPDIRKIARSAAALPTADILPLLHSEWHEERVLALLILVRQFEIGDERTKRSLFNLYLGETRWINNWDLVDLSAYQIVGARLVGRPRTILRQLARSDVLWERRIAVVSTYAFIRTGDLDDTFELSERLLGDPHDLMHKACGWMLREAGKRDRPALETFLNRHATAMPRTMLRYAIEKFPEAERQAILARSRLRR